MNDERVIINAIKGRKSSLKEVQENSRAKEVNEDLFDGIGVSGKKDAISKMVKSYNRRDSWKRKPCLQWNGSDFIRYLDSILKDFKVPKTFGNYRQECYYINSLYDTMVGLLGEKMNNGVLKDYIQWWCSIKAPRLTGSGFYLKMLVSDSMMKKFVSRYENNDNSLTEKPMINTFSSLPDINDDISMYNLGGVPLLLIKRGIVISRFVSIQQGTEEHKSNNEIIKFLSEFNLEAIQKVVDITISNAPYAKCMEFDFISLIHSKLHYSQSLNIVNLEYKSYFN